MKSPIRPFHFHGLVNELDEQRQQPLRMSPTTLAAIAEVMIVIFVEEDIAHSDQASGGQQGFTVARTGVAPYLATRTASIFGFCAGGKGGSVAAGRIR